MAKPRYNRPPAQPEPEPEPEYLDNEGFEDYLDRKAREEAEAEEKRLKERYGDDYRPFKVEDDWDPHMGSL